MNGRRTPNIVKQTLKATRAAGFEPVRVEVGTDGQFIVVIGKVDVEFAAMRDSETSEDVKKLI